MEIATIQPWREYHEENKEIEKHPYKQRRYADRMFKYNGNLSIYSADVSKMPEGIVF